MDSFSTQIITKALDCLSARSVITADNIANAGTSGYRPLSLSFERALADAAAAGPDAVRAVTPRVERAVDRKTGSEPRLDLELATASTTALRYSALIDLLNRQMQLHSMAVARGN